MYMISVTQIFLVVAKTPSENANLQGAPASPSMMATALPNLAQVIMGLAITINTTAFQPGTLDQPSSR
jgi:hypothetical protein